VFFKGKPLKNKVITVRNRNEASIHQYSQTDNTGICSFKLERKGTWFFHATHIIASTDKSKSDWESFWTTFSFAL